jgi:hypothetical protein
MEAKGERALPALTRGIRAVGRQQAASKRMEIPRTTCFNQIKVLSQSMLDIVKH